MKYPKNRPVLFEYESYRPFIKDMIEYLKESNSSLDSFRAVSVHLGFRSQSLLSMIISAERNLTSENIDKLTRGLELNKKESRYFLNLVNFEQASTIEEKSYYSHQLILANVGANSSQIKKAQLKYLTDLHYITIREMTNIRNFEENPEKIAKSLIPSIGVAKVKKAIKELEKFNYLKRNQEGKVVGAEEIVTTGDVGQWDKIKLNALRKLHKQMGELAVEHLSKGDPKERNISGVTVTLSKSKFTRITALLAELRREILKIENENEPDIGKDDQEVYRINLQLFPLTKWNKKGGKK